MKKLSGRLAGAMVALFVAALFLAGCYETHYYHRYHHHTREWYPRHHREPPAGVDFNVDIYKR